MSNNNISIVHVAREVHPFGGVSGVVHALDAAMRAMGVDSRIIARTPRAATNSRLKGRLTLMADVVAFTFSSSFAAIRARRDARTIVIVHNDGIVGDIYVDHGLHKAMVAQRPYIVLRNPLHLFIYVREELRHRLRLYRHLVSLSQFSKRQLELYFPMAKAIPTTVIPNGVDLARFDAIGRAAEDESRLRLIFVGHEYERKGLHWVLKALERVDPSVTLTVVGGSDEEIARARESAEAAGVASRVTFLGKRSDVNTLLLAHDVMVFPSAFESWQLVVLEAMASGVPVLATPVGCAEEVVVDGETGYLVTADDRDIARRIDEILADRSKLPAMRRKARAMAERYSWSSIARRYVAVAEQVRAARQDERAR